jgi:hypothetical protein
MRKELVKVLVKKLMNVCLQNAKRLLFKHGLAIDQLGS